MSYPVCFSIASEDVGYERLFLVGAVIRLYRAKKSRAVDHALIIFYEAPRAKRPIPDFALDRHTGRGRALKRGWRHFWEEGARLEDSEARSDPYATQARIIRRDAQDELPLE